MNETPEERGSWAIPVPDGFRVAGYEVTGQVGTGSWGSVYAARPCAGSGVRDEIVALKFLPAGSLTPAQHAGLAGIVARERRFSMVADHPRLVRTYAVETVDDPGSGQLQGAVVLVMEQAETTVAALLDGAQAGVPVPAAARLLAEVCEGVAYMHELGWVHGDLKPSNVLIMADGGVRISDFGLTSELEGTHAYTPHAGSSDHLPPEWWTERASPSGLRSRLTRDIWALGVLAHELFAGGMHPFPGQTPRARLAAVRAYASGRDPLRLWPGIPAPWRRLIEDCLQPSHELRLPYDADSLLRRIRELTEPTPARPIRAHRGFRRAASAVAVLTLTTLAVEAEPDTVPPGYRLYAGSEFTAMIPGGWTVKGAGENVTFKDPEAAVHSISVAALTGSGTGARAVAQSATQRMSTRFERYRQIGPVRDGALLGRTTADLEFSYINSGLPCRARVRVLPVAGRFQLIMLLTHQDRWDVGAHQFDRFLRSYTLA